MAGGIAVPAMRIRRMDKGAYATTRQSESEGPLVGCVRNASSFHMSTNR